MSSRTLRWFVVGLGIAVAAGIAAALVRRSGVCGESMEDLGETELTARPAEAEDALQIEDAWQTEDVMHAA